MNRNDAFSPSLTWSVRGYALITAWAIVRDVLGRPPIPWLTALLTVIAFALALWHAGLRMGWRDAVLFWTLTFVVSLAFESVGVLTGRVYGPYHYTARLGPKAFGLVPWLIPVAWFMMTYPSFVIAQWVVPRAWRGARRFWMQAAITGVVMAAWDLVMDPLMVRAGHWVWEVEGGYFGVPLQNYLGWWLTVAATVVVFQAIRRASTAPPQDGAFDGLVVGLYLVTAGGNLMVAWLYGLSGPALAGGAAMLPWLLMGWWAMRPPAAPERRAG